MDRCCVFEFWLILILSFKLAKNEEEEESALSNDMGIVLHLNRSDFQLRML